MQKNKSGIVLVGICAAALSACAPVVHNRGYVFVQQSLDQVTVGQTGKEDVRAIMGSPSTVATVDASAFYYISSREETYLYRAPVETERRIVAIYFDDKDVVAQIAQYGLEDGNVVDYVKRETVTRGKELSLLGQLFGNIGRFSSSSGSSIPGSQN
ncbi:MAG: outer membrane protein assembly factor BamE [Parvibaculales bacterium]